MQWFNPISTLQYYNNTPGIPCYQEQLLFPSDLILQGSFAQGSKNYTLQINLYTVDGLTNLGDITSYFDYYFANNPYNGNHLFVARLKTYPAAMCNKGCFILNVILTDNAVNQILFYSFTEQYRINNCCDTAKSITVTQDGIITTSTTISTASPITSVPTGPCGEALIRIISYNDCYDNDSGILYDTLSGYIGGSEWFAFRKLSTFKGRIVKRPYELTKTYSYNCALQKVESSSIYLLEGYEYFPTYKMDEITNQLKSQHVIVDNFNVYREYMYFGGTPFKKVDGARSCDELFKLEAQLNDCYARQIFGCDNGCVANEAVTSFFVVPGEYNGEYFYDINRSVIATNYSELLTWFASQDGVISVVNKDLSCLDCDVYGAIEIQTTTPIPYIYYFQPFSRNKIYPISIDDFCEICGTIGYVQCSRPVIDTLTIEDVSCNAPSVGTLTIEDITPDIVDVFTYGDWTVSIAPDSIGYLSNGAVSLDIKSKNIASIVGSVGEEVSLSNEIIGTISINGRPTTQWVITSAQNGSIPSGAIIAINPDGTVQLSGTFTLIVDNQLEVTFTELIYNV